MKIPRGTGSIWQPDSLPAWFPVTLAKGKDDTEGKTADLHCPNGHPGLLTDHDIAQDGAVTPSVICTAEGCDFHEFVHLEGWAP